MNAIYEYNEDGTREYLGEGNVHPLQQNVTTMQGHLEAAAKLVVEALMSGSPDLPFYVSHYNMADAAHRRAVTNLRYHERLSINWYQMNQMGYKQA